MLLSRGVGRRRLCLDPTTTTTTADREGGREGRKWSVEGADGTEFGRQLLAQVGMDITFLKETPAVGERKALS